MKKILITLTMSLIAISVFGQTKEIVEARIWKMGNFCKLPDSVRIPYAQKYSAVRSSIPCDFFNKKSYTGIWITFEGKDVDDIYMKSHCKNISLVRKTTKDTLYPVAYMAAVYDNFRFDKPEYLVNATTFENFRYLLNPREKYDLFIIFEKAKPGDRVIIENFLEAKIKSSKKPKQATKSLWNTFWKQK